MSKTSKKAVKKPTNPLRDEILSLLAPTNIKLSSFEGIGYSAVINLFTDKSIDRRMLLFREKHGTRLFDGRSAEKVMAACLLILKDRWTGKYAWVDAYKALTEEESDKPEPLGFDEAAIASMPKSLQEDAKRKLDAHKKEIQQHAASVEEWKCIVNAVNNDDGAMAYAVCVNRRDYEYEAWDFQYFTDATQDSMEADSENDDDNE